MNAEGWYRDPYRVPADRWFSDGHPTALVRDTQGVESHDPPPEAEYPGTLTEVEVTEPANAADLKRADAAESKSSSDDLKRVDQPESTISYGDAALDAGAESGIGFD